MDLWRSAEAVASPRQAAALPMHPDPTDSDDLSASPRERLRRLDVSLPCQGCGFETRGLAIDAPCPECGEAVWRSVAAAVDLAAAVADPERLPRRGSAARLLGVATLAAAILTLLPPSIWSARLAGSVAEPAPLIAVAWWVAAAAIILATRRLAASALERHGPSRLLLAAAPLWAAFGTVSTGLAGELAGPALADWQWHASAAANGCLALLLLGAGLCIERLGPASRRWRRRGAARQNPWLVTATQATALLLAGAAHAADSLGWPGAATLLGLLAAAAMLLVLVGSAYLMVNAIWIAGDLARGRPGAEDLLRSPRS